MPVVPKSFSYAQKKYPSEARNKSGKQLISCNSKRQIIERTEKQNASSRYFNSSRAHHAAEGKFDEPIGSAGNRPQGGLCKPPARPVVMIVVPAFAADGDPLAVVNNLSDFIFSLIRAVGLILLGFGILQVGLSLKSHDPSQRANGILTIAGGIVITFTKEILTLITG